MTFSFELDSLKRRPNRLSYKKATLEAGTLPRKAR